MSVRGPSLRRLLIAGAVVLLGLALALALLGGVQGQAQATKSPPKAKTHPVPAFTLDPSWPKALPNNWVFGGADSVAVDKHGHVWVLSRPLAVPPAELAAGKIASPPVIELDQDGNFIRGWGGPQWVQPWFVTPTPLPDYPIGTPAEHGIYVDNDDNVWLTGSGHIVLKFSPSGELLLQIGEFGKTGGSNDPKLLGNPTDMAVDTKSNEVFVADGYLNRRVIVFDSETGQYKRHWGAYGNVPNDDPPELYQPGKPLPQQFFIVHGIQLSNDGLLYVSDRQRDRVQVFTKDGTFVREAVVDGNAPAGGGITVKGVFTNPRRLRRRVRLGRPHRLLGRQGAALPLRLLDPRDHPHPAPQGPDGGRVVPGGGAAPHRLGPGRQHLHQRRQDAAALHADEPVTQEVT